MSSRTEESLLTRVGEKHKPVFACVSVCDQTRLLLELMPSINEVYAAMDDCVPNYSLRCGPRTGLGKS